MRSRGNLKGTWPQALVSFFSPIILILALRWAVLEPYVIPSGSMIPNLLIHDHIFVKKFAFGVRWPFSDQWLVHWADPQPGDVVVFRYPENPELFFIKRLIGRPGDEVRVEGGRISVNGKEWKITESLSLPDEEDAVDFNYHVEDDGRDRHIIRFAQRGPFMPFEKVWTVPQGQYFFMGDNRDQSSDGRVWGFVPEKYLVGKAWLIWLSCDEMLESAKFVCDPSTMRWKRLFRSVDDPPRS